MYIDTPENATVKSDNLENSDPVRSAAREMDREGEWIRLRSRISPVEEYYTRVAHLQASHPAANAGDIFKMLLDEYRDELDEMENPPGREPAEERLPSLAAQSDAISSTDLSAHQITRSSGSAGITRDKHRQSKQSKQIESSLIANDVCEASPEEGEPGLSSGATLSDREWFAANKAKPLDLFVAAAIQHAESVRQGSEESDFAGRDSLYRFTWLARGHRDLEPYLDKPQEALDTVETILKRLAAQSRNDIDGDDRLPYPDRGGDHWGVWFDVSEDNAAEKFFAVWTKMLLRPGQGPLEQAIQAAKETRLTLPDEVKARRRREDPRKMYRCYSFLVSIAGHLQRIVGDRPIQLPEIKLGELLGVDHGTVSLWRRSAKEDGYLVEVQEYVKGRRATDFRFVIEKWPEIFNDAEIAEIPPKLQTNAFRRAWSEWQTHLQESRATACGILCRA